MVILPEVEAVLNAHKAVVTGLDVLILRSGNQTIRSPTPAPNSLGT